MPPEFHLDGSQVAILVSVISSYISLKVAQARVEVKVDKLEKDMNNLGRKFRGNNEEEKCK